MKSLLIVLSVFLLSPAYAIQCEWWQTKYSAATVDQHPRQGTKGVREHPRSEYCRDKWKDASLHLKQFKDEPIPGWPHKGEIFKKWSRDEIQLILEILPTLPSWAEILNYNFRRAKDSNIPGNPASSELLNKSIILYNQFFKKQNKKSAIVHESAHHIYYKLGPDGIKEFADLSGWELEVDKLGKVFEIPPKVLIQPDSSVSKEEDFSNHVEEFYESPEIYAKKFPKIHQFLKGRLK